MNKFLWLFCLLSYYSYSQIGHTKVNFDHIDVNHGLSNNWVTGISQDKKGYIWVGTNEGINRYDGMGFTTYYKSDKEPNGLSGNYITKVITDSEGTVWVTVYQQGLFYYDPILDHFVSQSEFSKKCVVENIRELGEDELWAMGTLNGHSIVSIQNKKTKTWHTYQIMSSQEPVSDIFKISDSTYWVSIRNKGLIKWNRITNTLVENVSLREKLSLSILSIKKDYLNNIWFTSRDGLYKLSSTDQKFTTYGVNPKIKENSLPVNAALEVEPDGKYLWIGTENGGLCRLEILTNKIHLFKPKKGDDFSVADNTIRAIYKDRQQRLWFGTFTNGISCYDKHKYKFGQLDIELENDVVSSILKDTKGRIWLGTGDGLVMKDNGKVVVFKHIPNNPSSIDSNQILTVYQDSKGNIWIGTWNGGLNRYDEITQGFIHYESLKKNKVSFQGSNVYSIFERANGNGLLVGGFLGLNVLEDISQDKFRWFPDHEILSNNYIKKVFEDSNGFVWTGSTSQVNKLNLKNGERIRFFYDSAKNRGIRVNCIIEDRHHQIWIGSDQGLHLISEGKIQGLYTTANGLPSGEVMSIVEDDSDNLWITTAKGISKFNMTNRKFLNFDMSDGLISNAFKWNSSYKDKEGLIYFGCKGGVVVFDPDSISTNSFVPPVIITGFKVFNQPLTSDGNYNTLKQIITENKEVTLEYKNSDFTIDFVALNLTSSFKNQYAYKLENFDRGWVNTRGGRSAIYTNIDPGTYTFRVKASNNHGLWNETGTSLVIRILPPWWQTWWARLITIATLSSLILFIYRSWLKSQYLVKLQSLNRALDESTRMLAIKNEELLTSEDELKKSLEEQKQLSEVKNDFINNVTHEFKTPIATISGALEAIKLFNNENFTDKSKRYLDISQQQLERLNQLVEKVIETSKLDSSELILETQLTNIVHLVKICVENHRIYTSKNIHIESNVNEYMIEVDEFHFCNAISNLIDNSIKHGGNEINIRIFSQKDKLAIEVNDNGEGIPKQYAPYIFDRFYRIENSSKNKSKGFGIGLYYAKTIFEKHNGIIELFNRNTFRITLIPTISTLNGGVVIQS